jgi:chromosome segregation ATPase
VPHGRPSQIQAPVDSTIPVRQVATPVGNIYDANSQPPGLGGIITSLIHHSERTVQLSASQSENLAVTNGLLRSLKQILTEVHIEPVTDYPRHRGRLLDNNNKIQELHNQKGKRQADLDKGFQERTELRQKKEAMLQELQNLDRAIQDTERAVHVIEEELEVLKDEESKIIDNSRDILDQMWQPPDLDRLSL